MHRFSPSERTEVVQYFAVAHVENGYPNLCLKLLERDFDVTTDRLGCCVDLLGKI